MSGTDLGARYLDQVRRHGVSTRDLIGRTADSEMLNALYGGRYLPRPLFLSHQDRLRLYDDVATVHSALSSLPDRLFGGDLAAFARAVGMTDVQTSAIVRSPSTSLTRQARADLYRDETGFKLLELNIGSALGGMDNADMCRALLEHPVLRSFAEANRLGYVDTLREQVHNIVTETGVATDPPPVLVITDWPTSFQTLEPYMRQYASRYRELGLDAHWAHVGQLTARDGAVWLGRRKVDVIDRLFMVSDLLESAEAPALMDPVLDAASRGEVAIFTPLDSDLFGSKGALAMLSDEENRSLFDPGELAVLDRILPWTRMVRPGPVTLEDGRRVDLLRYALSHQHDLALKPTLLYGGQGVLLGWAGDTSAQAWEEQVRTAMNQPYVLQRRVRPVPELFPVDHGDPLPWVVTWGVFTGVRGYAGAFARATSIESGVEVTSLGAGAHVGCCLHIEAEPA